MRRTVSHVPLILIPSNASALKHHLGHAHYFESSLTVLQRYYAPRYGIPYNRLCRIGPICP